MKHIIWDLTFYCTEEVLENHKLFFTFVTGLKPTSSWPLCTPYIIDHNFDKIMQFHDIQHLVHPLLSTLSIVRPDFRNTKCAFKKYVLFRLNCSCLICVVLEFFMWCFVFRVWCSPGVLMQLTPWRFPCRSYPARPNKQTTLGQPESRQESRIQNPGQNPDLNILCVFIASWDSTY